MAKTELYPKELPILGAMVEAVSIEEMPSFQNIYFVCVQHILHTTVNLMESLVYLGARPDNIHIMGKSYSTSPKVVDRLIENGYNYHPNTLQEKLAGFTEVFKKDIKCMWERVYDNLQKKNVSLVVILDDGGVCLTNVPSFIKDTYPLVGVEQTTAGLTKLHHQKLCFPVIEVASSAAKKLVESPMIAEAVIKKLEDVLPMDGERFTCGVAGQGAIGRAITQKLISLNHKVMLYDKHIEETQYAKTAISTPSLEELVCKNEYIFGCSGYDITKNLDVQDINAQKTFISCSSQDKEFLTLLKIFRQNKCEYNSVLDHLECKVNDQSVKIFRGGFPINLDNSGESVIPEDIQLTRGLLLGGIIQGILGALPHFTQKNVRYMLHPAIQSFVVSQWKMYGSTFLFPQELLDRFMILPWIKNHSKGAPVENGVLEMYYSSVSVNTPSISFRRTA